MNETQEIKEMGEDGYLMMAEMEIQNAPAKDAAVIWGMIRDFIRLTSKHKELVWKFCRCIREGEEARHEKD